MEITELTINGTPLLKSFWFWLILLLIIIN